MRFSLKTLLIVFLLIGLAVGWYVKKREAELGVEFRVPKPIEQSEFNDAPDLIREFRSQKLVRALSNRQQRLVKIPVNLRNFRIHVDDKLLQTNRDRFVELAKSQFQDRDQVTAFKAAWILDRYGDQAAYQQVRDRMIASFSGDATTENTEAFHKFAEVFGDERLAGDPVYVAFLKSHAIPGDPLEWASSAFLHYQGVDDQPYQTFMLRKAKHGRDKSWALVWLVENHWTGETEQVLREFLNSLKPNSLSRFSRLKQFLEIERADPKWIELRNRLEQSSYGFLRNPDPKYWKREQTEQWDMMSQHGTLVSADLFRNAFENTVGQDEHRRSQHLVASVRGLERLGLRTDAETLLRKVLEAEKHYDPYALDDTKIEMLNLAEKFWGPEKTIKICTDHIGHGRCQGSCKKLAAMFENSGNESIAKLIAEAGDGYHRNESIVQLEQIGTELLPDLWKAAEIRQNTYKLHQNWKSKNIDRNSFVDWVNQTFQPTPLLTVESVLKCSRYKDDSNYWKIKPPAIHTDYQFAMAALAHSGHGILVSDYHTFGRENVADVLKEIAQSGQPDFKWESEKTDYEPGSYVHSFVVNNRLYQFSILEGRDLIEESGERFYDNSYPMASNLEVLNAVAIRQRIKERFFLYPGEGMGRNVDLVAFLSGKIARQLKAKFGIEPRIGFGYYLNH